MILTFELRGCSSVQPVFLLLKARDFQNDFDFVFRFLQSLFGIQKIMWHSIMVFIRFCFYFISRMVCIRFCFILLLFLFKILSLELDDFCRMRGCRVVPGFDKLWQICMSSELAFFFI